MIVFYWFVIIILSFVCIFFLARSVLTLLSFFTTSPFVPLEKKLIEGGLEFLDVGEGDRFIDIGSGDGRVVAYCAQKYPNADLYKGIEIIPILLPISNVRKIFSKNKEKISFQRDDAKKHNYSNYNKVFMYLLPEFVSDLMPKLKKELPKGAVVVSVAFAIPQSYKSSGELKVHEVKFGRKKKKIYVWRKK